LANLTQIYPIAEKLVVNSTYSISSQPYTPFPLWVAVAGAAIIFLVLCFAYKLRGIDGRVSSERIAYSLIAGIVNGTAAWLSVQIAIPSSVAEMSGTSSGLVVVQNYTVYSQAEIVILFIIFSMIAFANFVYTFMQPELLVPEKDEMRGKDQDAKVKAEEKE
jgi:hypothetical protein